MLQIVNHIFSDILLHVLYLLFKEKYEVSITNSFLPRDEIIKFTLLNYEFDILLLIKYVNDILSI